MPHHTTVSNLSIGMFGNNLMSSIQTKKLKQRKKKVSHSKSKEKLAERIDYYSGEMLNPRAHSILIFKFIILSLYRTSLSQQICMSHDNYFRTVLVATLLLMYVHYKPS